MCIYGRNSNVYSPTHVNYIVSTANYCVAFLCIRQTKLTVKYALSPFRTNLWHEGPELCSRRRHVGVAYLDGRLYAVGGHDGHQHLNSVECYDPKKGAWHYVQPMKTLRRGIAVGAIGGPMYAVGQLGHTHGRLMERGEAGVGDPWREGEGGPMETGGGRPRGGGGGGGYA